MRENLRDDATAEAKGKLQQLDKVIGLFNLTGKPGDLEVLLAKGKTLLETLSSP